MKTLEKIFSDENLKEYDEFVKILIKEMFEDDTFFFVMSDRNVRKLAQIMAASPHASMWYWREDLLLVEFYLNLCYQ